MFLHPGSAAALHDLVALEHECCPWITFVVDGATVEMTADGEGEGALLALFGYRP